MEAIIYYYFILVIYGPSFVVKGRIFFLIIIIFKCFGFEEVGF